jgi:hypothetical protein
VHKRFRDAEPEPNQLTAPQSYKFQGGTEMAKVKNWRFNDLATRHLVKLVVGLVLGAVVLSGTALYFGPNQFQEEHSPVPDGIASNKLTGNDFRIMEEQRAADRQEDLRDMIQYWNQLKKDEAASPSSSRQITEASQAASYWIRRDEAEEMAYDELSKSFVGIAYPSSQTIEAFRDPS